jgi:hypothetical protein
MVRPWDIFSFLRTPPLLARPGDKRARLSPVSALPLAATWRLGASQRQHILAWLGALILIDLLAACSEITPPSTLRILTANPPPSPGRWSILALSVDTLNDANGYKYIRIPIAVENQAFQFIYPSKINVAESKIFTSQGPFLAHLFETTGVSPTKVTMIDYPEHGLVPPGFHLHGVYRNGAVSKYFFQAQMPQAAFPFTLVIPEYLNQISLTATLPLTTVTSPSNRYVIAKDTPVEIAGKAVLTVSHIVTNAVNNPHQLDAPIYDRVIITVHLKSRVDSGDTRVTVYATAVGDNCIMGFPAFDEQLGCKRPPFTLGPSTAQTVTLCALVPRGSRDVYVVLYGDLHAAYKAY